MSAPPGRVRVGGYLTAEAAAAWSTFCARHGCNITALLEAVGKELAAGDAADDAPLSSFVDAARLIGAERARRRPIVDT